MAIAPDLLVYNSYYTLKQRGRANVPVLLLVLYNFWTSKPANKSVSSAQVLSHRKFAFYNG